MPWRDQDVLHVLLVGIAITVLTAGGAYLWFFAQTVHQARHAPRDAGDAASAIVFGKRLVDGAPTGNSAGDCGMRCACYAPIRGCASC